MTDSPVLVLGASGAIGSRIVAGLTSAGRPVRAASRAPGRVPHAESVAFDWDDPSTHATALGDASAVHLLAPPGTARPEEQALPFLELARERGVRRVTLLSASSIEAGDPGLGTIHAWLADSGLEWAVLRPTWFAQNMLRTTHHVGRAIADGIPFVTATGDGRIPFVDAADIAAVAIRALLDDVSHDTDHVITGPQALSYDEVAALARELTGRPTRHQQGSSEEAVAFMVASGIDPAYAALLATMEQHIAGGSEDRVTDVVERVTGRPPRPLRAVLSEALSAEPGREPLDLASLGLPDALRRHLEAVTGPRPATVRDAWEPDGVLEFPYAPAGSSSARLEGIDAIVGYFDGLAVFRDWSFRDPRLRPLGDDGPVDDYVLELHGSATLIATGAAYEQDYVQLFGISARGRLTWLREYWDPTRMDPAPS